MSKARRDKFGIADWLYLAAAPTFAVMALLTRVQSGAAETICAPGQDASLLTGMTLMYVLMSAFHLAPWIKLLSRREAAPVALDRVSRD